MPFEGPPQEENLESGFEKERSRFEANVGDLKTNLDEVEASSPSRREKLRDFIVNNYAPMIGGIVGVGGLQGLMEDVGSGNWEKSLIRLGVGAGAGKLLEIGYRRLLKFATKEGEK